MSSTLDRSAVQASLNVWQMAQRQLDDVAELIGLDSSIHAYLREPKRISARLGAGRAWTMGRFECSKAIACSTTCRADQPRAASASIPM